jgi:hypothetical protein
MDDKVQFGITHCFFLELQSRHFESKTNFIKESMTTLRPRYSLVPPIVSLLEQQKSHFESETNFGKASATKWKPQ